MKPFIITLMCVLTFSVAHSQELQIINTGGGYDTNPQGSLSFSIGEIITETIYQGDKRLTQGFFQANITTTSVFEIPSLDYELLAYPNPTKDFVILKISKEKLINLSYYLFDKSGKIIDSKRISSNETIIPFNFLSPSTYYLKVVENQIEVKTFKIVKLN